ncbi:MAG: hypothetical protein JWR83_572 [Aeromicrobium sp.]|nr:hypothetical protein [Aeromicrobium sp.]
MTRWRLETTEEFDKTLKNLDKPVRQRILVDIKDDRLVIVAIGVGHRSTVYE